jgi:hypothetical protein
MMVDGLVAFFTFIVILPDGELVDRLHCLIFLRRCYSDCAGHEIPVSAILYRIIQKIFSSTSNTTLQMCLDIVTVIAAI